MRLPLTDFHVIMSEPFALLLPSLAILLLLVSRQSENSLRFPSIRGLMKIPPSLRQRLYVPVMRSLIAAFLLCAGIAAARPQVVVKNDEFAQSRNIMAAVDTSKSMLSGDIARPGGAVSRLDAVKDALKAFLASRSGDLIGLVVFGSDVFLRTPLTRDFDSIRIALSDIQVGVAGDRTAIGDALAHSVKRIAGLPARSRAIILFTDGLNTGGTVDPLKAASTASSLGIRVYTVGIGRSSGELKTFAEREERAEEFDEYTLRKIASITGGMYANAASTFDFDRIAREIDQREAILDVEPQRPVIYEGFVPLAGAASAALLLFLILELTYFRKLP